MKLFVLFVAVCIAGCAASIPMDKDSGAKTEFTFDYAVPNKSKSELWQEARDYFATAFGDSRAVLRVEDENEGTLIGKGKASWYPPGNIACYSDYDVRFIAKDGKARLQMILQLDGPEGPGACTMWPRPSKPGYEEIVASFQIFSDSLSKVLSTDHGSNGTWKDF